MRRPDKGDAAGAGQRINLGSSRFTFPCFPFAVSRFPCLSFTLIGSNFDPNSFNWTQHQLKVKLAYPPPPLPLPAWHYRLSSVKWHRFLILYLRSTERAKCCKNSTALGIVLAKGCRCQLHVQPGDVQVELKTKNRCKQCLTSSYPITNFWTPWVARNISLRVTRVLRYMFKYSSSKYTINT